MFDFDEEMEEEMVEEIDLARYNQYSFDHGIHWHQGNVRDALANYIGHGMLRSGVTLRERGPLQTYDHMGLAAAVTEFIALKLDAPLQGEADSPWGFAAQTELATMLFHHLMKYPSHEQVAGLYHLSPGEAIELARSIIRGECDDE